MLLGVISCVQEELDGFKQAYLLIEILCMRSMLDKWVKSSCLKMVALSHGNSHNHMPFIQASECCDNHNIIITELLEPDLWPKNLQAIFLDRIPTRQNDSLEYNSPQSKTSQHFSWMGKGISLLYQQKQNNIGTLE
jgi:hypothetical protein